MELNATSLSLGTLLFGALCWLLNQWLGKRIDASIQAEKDKQKLEWEAEHRRREKAQLVAELLAEWSSHAFKPQLTADERQRINRLSYEASLWLPEDISRELSRVLQHHPSAMNQHDLLLEVRRRLSGPHNLIANDVTVWQPHHELPNRGIPEGCRNGIVTVNRAQIEIAGTTHEAEFDSKSICLLPAGATLHLDFTVGGRIAHASTSAVQSLVRLQPSGSAGSPGVLTLRLFPTDKADEINRRVFGSPRPAS